MLGPVELIGAAGAPITMPGNKIRGLLAMLALEVGRIVPSERLIDGLWGEQGAHDINVLQVTVSKLRRTISEAGEPGCISTHPTGYRLDIDRDAIDALLFEALVEQARAMGDDPAAAAEILARALELWQGAPLAGVPDTELSTALRSRLQELRLIAVDDLLDARLSLGHHARLVPDLEAMVTEDPLRERRWAQLVRALYGSGRQAEATRAFQRAREVLIEQIGIEPGAELRRLEAAVLAQDETVLGIPISKSDQPIGEGFRRRGNLRHPVGPCLGRAEELARLTGLNRCRLLTLTGPGGVGKTRLAIEHCSTLKDDTPDGVWWVELAAARSDLDVLGAIQRSLGMDAAASDPSAALESICTILADRSAVLALDNCEHVLDAVVPAVEELLARCGQLRIVATSRQGLDVPAESRFPVAPLQPSPAVELFKSRTADAFDDPDSATAILEICERLDRLPLALELAAARTRHLSLDEIRERLADRFELLGDGSRTAHIHQRNLRGVAEWSYELLDETERIVFERMSVFADGVPVEAARQVCVLPGAAGSDVEAVLHRLVDKSLVVADRSGARTRFRMLQTLADYASERLDEHGERDATMRAHARWVLALSRSVEFGTATDGPLVAAVQDELIAIRDAIGWSLDADPVLALEICAALSAFWFGTMRVSVGWELLAMALDAARIVDPALRATGLAWATVFATMVQDMESADRHAGEALAFERELGDSRRLGTICFAVALAAGYRRDRDATKWIAEARRHFDDSADPIGLGHVSFAEGAALLVDGDLDAAATSLHDAVDAFRHEGDHLGLILAVSRLGELAWRRNDIELFAEMHAELLELGRAGRSEGVIAGATARLALARLVQGQIDEAERLARLALTSSSESFMPVVNGYAFRTAGLVNLRLEHIVEGEAQLRDAIEAFGQGAGGVGVGQAAMCWIDLSVSHVEAGDMDEARSAADRAVEIALASGDRWVLGQAQSHRALVTETTTSP